MPEDAGALASALRLGWHMAEVRGRNRPDGPLALDAGRYPRSGHPLPLSSERTPAELRIQAQAVLVSMAGQLGVAASPNASYTVDLDQRCKSLAMIADRGGPEAAREWAALAELIFMFDAHIQDRLTARSDVLAGGYLLGRALAECYWALDPGPEVSQADPASWGFLFGEPRYRELRRLLGRLSAHLPDYAVPAIEGSLTAWKAVAADPAWRVAAQPFLYRQIAVWYELVLLGQDPATLIRPYARLRNIYVASRAVRFFSGRLFLAGAGVAGLIVLIITLGSDNGSTVATTFLAILAAAGLSAAGLSAKRFAQQVSVDLVTLAVAVIPPKPGLRPARNLRMVYRAVSAR